MPGRRPTPTAMKLATGNPGKRAINNAEPTAKGIPVMPDHLSPAARTMWFKISPILAGMGVLAEADAIALERLCETYAEVVSLEKQLRRGGRVQKVRTKSKAIFERQRPQVAMLADADRRLKSYLVEFGLSPAARSKVHVAPNENENPEDAYFGSGSKAG